MERVVLIQTGFVGDVVLTTPLIDAIIDKHRPNTTLDIVTTKGSAALFNNDSRIANVMVYDKKGGDTFWHVVTTLRKNNYTYCYLPHKSIRSALLAFCSRIPHRIGFGGGLKSLLYTQACGLLSPSLSEPDRKLSLILTEEMLRKGHSYEQRLSVNPKALASIQSRVPANSRLAIVGPTSVWKTKQWSPEKFKDVAHYLTQRGYRVVITGAPGQEETCNAATPKSDNVINLCGNTSLDELVALVSYSSIVVCNDSALCHIAASFKIPTVVVFCATHPKQGFSPYKNPKSKVIGDDSLSCRPCGRHGGHDCPLGTYDCINGVSTEMAIDAIDSLLL